MVRERTDASVKESSLNEMKRNRGFETLVKRFNANQKRIQEIVKQSDASLSSLNRKEKAIIDSIAAKNAPIIRQIHSGQDALKRKIESSDKFIMHMNNQITKMKIELENLQEGKLEKRLTALQKDIDLREKAKQKSVDARLNELDRKMANLMGIVGTWKKKQQAELVNLLKEEG